MAPLSAVLRAASLILLLCTLSALSSPLHNDDDGTAIPPLLPSDAAILRNAFSIFNAVHSAMRQWGSSLNHNGMSMFLATVPEGQLFYHGGGEAQRPRGINGKSFDWLAFDLEHAQMFGISRGMRMPTRPPPGGNPPTDESLAEGSAWDWDMPSTFYDRRRDSWSFSDEGAQKILGNDDDDDDDDGDDGKPKRPERPDFSSPFRGYFHTYRANRPLSLLYIDGMAAGKTGYGCLDTQDYVLLNMSQDKGNDRDRDWGGEMGRAGGLCDLAQQWAWEGGRIDGFVRTEAGFEIIYCDFSEGGGLDVVAIQPSPFSNETGGLPVFAEAEFLRGVSQRYHGFPSGRIHVDWSSMVSAFFYNVNLTNPDASRPELPRLTNTTRDERRGIRARLREVVAARGGSVSPLVSGAAVDWQGIVDLVVTRFSRRLGQLARDTSAPITELASQMLPTLLYPYINFTDPAEPHALQFDRCTKHYLLGALARESTWTPEDRSIYLALETVTRTICSSLFEMRSVLYDASANESDDGDEKDSDPKEQQVRQIVDVLMDKLQWTTWRECDPCQSPDELCLVAMFPWGSDEDHFHPRCKAMDDLQTRNNYWRNGLRPS